MHDEQGQLQQKRKRKIPAHLNAPNLCKCFSTTVWQNDYKVIRESHTKL